MLSGCAGIKEETADDETEVEEVQPVPPPPKPFVPLIATRKVTIINNFGQVSETDSKIFRKGYRIRVESIGSIPKDISIFDYEAKKEYRIQEGDHIYFDIDVSSTLMGRAQREGLIPIQPNPNIESTEIHLGKMEVNGHPCDIVLLVDKREFKVRGVEYKKYTYSVRFEAVDLDRQPLRVVYNQSLRTLVIIDYADIETKIDDPSLLKVPEDYLSFTPY